MAARPVEPRVEHHAERREHEEGNRVGARLGDVRRQLAERAPDPRREHPHAGGDPEQRGNLEGLERPDQQQQPRGEERGAGERERHPPEHGQRAHAADDRRVLQGRVEGAERGGRDQEGDRGEVEALHRDHPGEREDERLLLTVNNLGVLYYLQGDFDQAESVLNQGLEKAAPLPNSRPELYLQVSLADVKRDKGEHALALDMYRKALDLARLTDEAVISVYLADAMANTYRLMGDASNCESWAKRASAEAEDRAGILELGLCATTLGLIQRDKGQLKESAASLERAAELLKESDAKRELAKAHFHLAGVYFSLKRKKLALDSLEIAAALAAELGYDHFLQVEAARMPLLVQYAAANKLADGYFERMLKGMKASRPVARRGIAERRRERRGHVLGDDGVRLRQSAGRGPRPRDHRPRMA